MSRAIDRRTSHDLIAAQRRHSRRGGARMTVVLLALGGGLVVGGCGSSGGASDEAARAEGGGFSSAEEAVTAYTDALAAGDFDALLQVFAIETYVEHLDFGASLERVGVYQPLGGGLPLPSSDPFNESINVEQRRATVASTIRNQYFTLANPELDTTISQRLADAEAVEQLTSSLEATMRADALAGFAEAEFVALEDVDASAAELFVSDASRGNDEAMLAILGADESAELAVRAAAGDRGGEPVVATFRAVRYGDRWWLETLGGQFATLVGGSALHAGVLLES